MKKVGEFYLPTKLGEEWGIAELAEIEVRVGQHVILTKLEIQKSKAKKTNFSMSPALREALLINSHKKMLIRYDAQAKQIHLGPTIGIMAKKLPVQEGETPTSVNSELIFLGRLAMTLPGQIYIFTPSSINWTDMNIRGYSFLGGGSKWVGGTYPLPDVVYDRITSRSFENKSQTVRAKEQLQSLPYLKYFNPSFLDKWTVHKILSTNPKLSSYVPETCEFSSDDLEYMMHKYQNLYVKPSNGSLGRGIIRLKRHGDHMVYSVKSRGKIVAQADSAEQFIKKTQIHRGSKLYIIQQGLDLDKYHDSPFDIRIIYQRNGRGEWHISKKFVRVAPKGSTISNLSNGGRVELSNKVFKKLFQSAEKIAEKNQELEFICRNVAQSLEKDHTQYYGELGLDIGIDKTGKLWLIEVNSKPRKTTNSDYSKTIMRTTFKRPLEYATFLAGFSYY